MAALDGEVMDHVERDDVAVELGVTDGRKRGHDGLGIRHGATFQPAERRLGTSDESRAFSEVPMIYSEGRGERPATVPSEVSDVFKYRQSTGNALRHRRF